jgi:hypothetical protein
LQARALIETKNARDARDAVGMWKQFAKNKLARDASEERPPVVALDDGAGVFHELAVFDGGRAGSFAGAAVEAFVDVIDERSGDRSASGCGGHGITPPTGRRLGLRGLGELALRDLDHLVDSAAR